MGGGSSYSRRSNANPPGSDIAASMSGLSLAENRREPERGMQRGGSIISSSHRSVRDESQSRASSSRHGRHEPPPSAVDNSSRRGPAERPSRSHRPPPLAFENSSHRGTDVSSRGPSTAKRYVGSEAPSGAGLSTSRRSAFDLGEAGTVVPEDSISNVSHRTRSRAPSSRHSHAPSRAHSPPPSAFENSSRATARGSSSRAPSSRDSHAPSRGRSPPPSAFENSSLALVRRSSSRAPASRVSLATSRARSPPPSTFENSSQALVRRSSSRAPCTRVNLAASLAASRAMSSQYNEMGTCPTCGDDLPDYDSDSSTGSVVPYPGPNRVAASMSSDSYGYIDPSTGAGYGVVNVQYQVAYGPRDRRLRRPF